MVPPSKEQRRGAGEAPGGPQARPPRQSWRVLAERNQSAAPVGVWVESAPGQPEQSPAFASVFEVEEELKEQQRQKAAKLRRFQGEVRQRVNRQVRMRRRQELQKSHEAFSRTTLCCSYYPALYAKTFLKLTYFGEHQQQPSLVFSLVASVASFLPILQFFIPISFSGSPKKPEPCPAAAVPAEGEGEELLLEGHHDLPAELQERGTAPSWAGQDDDFYIKIEFEKVCDGSVEDSSLPEPPRRPHTDYHPSLLRWAGVDEEETRKQRQSEFLRCRRLFMAIERERVKDQQRQRERQQRVAQMKRQKENQRRVEEQRMRDLAEQRKPSLGEGAWEALAQLQLEERRVKDRQQRDKEQARYVEALRAQMREKIKACNIDLPPLCSCGSEFWDSHPDTCANNCVFYKNHKDGDNYKELFGALDNAFLVAYAIGMFISGIFGERLPLRYYLSGGMVLSGLFTALFGLGYFWDIHVLWYFIVVQVCNGLVQTTGWPAVVACVGNWFGKGKRGLIMGIWNSHTSVGNILGSLIAGAWVSSAWGLSFVVPGIIITTVGIICFFFLVEYPEDVDCSPPLHHMASDEDPGGVTTSEKDPEAVTSNEGPLSLPGQSSVDHSNSPKEPAEEPEAISFLGALRIPGVVEFSLCLLFAKLVSYTFLYWLPLYIVNVAHFGAKEAGDLSTLFDVGGILGGIFAGLISDYTGGRATTCCVMLVVAAPMLFLYNHVGQNGIGTSIAMLIICGALVNGPYALITTAVSADLGTHESLKGNAKALSTVTAIIDGTGSVGAALGPLLAGLISPTGWNNVFYMLIAADVLACLLLARVVVKEVRGWCGYMARKRGSSVQLTESVMDEK
ncbi:sugar phosphate exchanger 2-like protein [Pitangus sulphuratus]|nr:sugar phosphate exchanger 2-like protein [Pitangus sulphuratus]